MPDFVQNGFVTPEGKRVIEQLETMLTEAEAAGDIQALNQLSGSTKHYYMHVRKLHDMNEAEWLRDYNYAAGAIYQTLAEADEKQAEQDALKEADAGLAGELEKLKLLLESVVSDNKNLRLEIDELKKPAKKSAKKAVEAEEEAE